MTLLSEKIKKNFNQNKEIFFIVALGVFLIFFRLNRADTLNDGSHYSMRALAYLDYIGPNLQTAPIQWFGSVPWWGNLSFHDAPPLVFLIQHIFFKIFGENIIALRLPFALSGVGVLIFVYLIAKKLFGKQTAVLSSLALAVSTFFLWSFRTAYLEGVETFFIAGAVYFFLKSLEKEKFWIHTGIFLALALLSKYTSFFLIPFMLIYTFIRHKQTFIQKKFWIGVSIFFLLILPVIVYNIMMYKARGHFDVQVSKLFPSMFEAAKKDWPILFSSTDNTISPFSNYIAIWRQLQGYHTFMFGILLIFSVIFVFVNWLIGMRRKMDSHRHFIPILLLSFSVIFISLPPATRYLPILMPLVSVAIGFSLSNLFEAFTGKRNIQKVLVIIFSVIFFIELAFSINTNLISHPRNEKPKFYSSTGEKSMGFNQLEDYLKTTWKENPLYIPYVRKPKNTNDLMFYWNNLKDNNLYIFDGDMDWFGRIWYFNRFFNYHKINFTSESEIETMVGLDKDLFDILRKVVGVHYVYYITIADNSMKHKTEYANLLEKNFLHNIDTLHNGEKVQIVNDYGENAFIVYKLRLN